MKRFNQRRSQTHLTYLSTSAHLTTKKILTTKSYCCKAMHPRCLLESCVRSVMKWSETSLHVYIIVLIFTQHFDELIIEHYQSGCVTALRTLRKNILRISIVSIQHRRRTLFRGSNHSFHNSSNIVRKLKRTSYIKSINEKLTSIKTLFWNLLPQDRSKYIIVCIILISSSLHINLLKEL